MAGRKKIVRLKEGSACEECPLRENTLYLTMVMIIIYTTQNVALMRTKN
jgi:hypothetical protein